MTGVRGLVPLSAQCHRGRRHRENSWYAPLLSSPLLSFFANSQPEYVPIGPRFSNAILQTLLVLFKRIPPKGRKLLVVGTTSNEDILRQMEFMECFSTILRVPVISTREEFKKALIGLEVPSPSLLSLSFPPFFPPPATRALRWPAPS